MGGTNGDYAEGIAVDSSGKAYVTGYTNSVYFPVQNSYQDNNAGSIDAFVAVLSSSNIDVDETASETWIDLYSSNTDDKEAVIWYDIIPDDFSGQIKMEIRDQIGKMYPWDGEPLSVSGGRGSIVWDGRSLNEYVSQPNNPYYISLVLLKDGQEMARSADHKIWVGRPVILLHGIWSTKEELETKKLYTELSKLYYIGSAEGHEYPDLQVGDEVNPRPLFLLSLNR